MKVRLIKKCPHFLKCQGDLTPLQPWVSIKDLFGLSNAFDIVSHKIVKKLLT